MFSMILLTGFIQLAIKTAISNNILIFDNKHSQDLQLHIYKIPQAQILKTGHI